MTRRFVIFACLLTSLLTACRALTPGAPGSGPGGPVSPSVAPATFAAGSSSPSVAPDTCGLGTAIAEYAYPGLREFASQFRSMSRGIAVTEVVSVGELQYSTESGERPSCDELEAAPAGFTIGRLVEVRVVTPVAGGVKRGQLLSYLYQGGSLGGDSSPGHPFGLGLPSVGDRMLAIVARDPVDADPGIGELPVDVFEMFLITPDGRIVTPDPAERATVDRAPELLRDVVPTASPGS
jgi:hypothetical protein